MQLSHFWEEMNRVFGRAYARTLASDLVISELGGRTVDEALEEGANLQDVWKAICDVQEIPADQRWSDQVRQTKAEPSRLRRTQ